MRPLNNAVLAFLHLSVLVTCQSPREKLIMFGEHIKIETMPHAVAGIVALEWPNDLNYFHGFLIHHRWVLTAAHVFKKMFKRPSFRDSLLKIRFGIDDVSQEGLVSDVRRIVCHEGYKQFMENDICLVQTMDEIPFSDSVQPATGQRDSPVGHSPPRRRLGCD